MKYYYNLYLSEEYHKKKKSVIKKLEKRQYSIEQYLIFLAPDEENQLEIVNSLFLKQSIYNKNELFVIGITFGKHDAYEIVEKITQEVYNVTGTTNIKKYLLERQKEFEEGNA